MGKALMPRFLSVVKNPIRHMQLRGFCRKDHRLRWWMRIGRLISRFQTANAEIANRVEQQARMSASADRRPVQTGP